MRQIIALIIVSVLAFAGIIFIKEYRLGQLENGGQDQKSETTASTDNPPPTPAVEKDKIPPTPPKEPEVEVTATAPKELIGTFAIDKAATQKWLMENNYGSDLDAEALLSIWPLLLIEFDGKMYKIGSGSHLSKQYFLPKEQSDSKIIIPLNLTQSENPTDYTITWDNEGFWASYNVPKPGTEEEFSAQIRFIKVTQ